MIVITSEMVKESNINASSPPNRQKDSWSKVHWGVISTQEFQFSLKATEDLPRKMNK